MARKKVVGNSKIPSKDCRFIYKLDSYRVLTYRVYVYIHIYIHVSFI